MAAHFRALHAFQLYQQQTCCQRQKAVPEALAQTNLHLNTRS